MDALSLSSCVQLSLGYSEPKTQVVSKPLHIINVHLLIVYQLCIISNQEFAEKWLFFCCGRQQLGFGEAR